MRSKMYIHSKNIIIILSIIAETYPLCHPKIHLSTQPHHDESSSCFGAEGTPISLEVIELLPSNETRMRPGLFESTLGVNWVQFKLFQESYKYDLALTFCHKLYSNTQADNVETMLRT